MTTTAMNYHPLGEHRTAKGSTAHAYLCTSEPVNQAPQTGRIMLFQEPWPTDVAPVMMVSDDGWNLTVGWIGWRDGVVMALAVPQRWRGRGYGALAVELALQCNPDLRDDGKVTAEGQGLLESLGLQASNAPVAEADPSAVPVVVPHLTSSGLWLVADTPAGRELMRRVPARPPVWQLDAVLDPSAGAGRAYGLMAAVAAMFLVFGGATGHWGVGAILAALALLCMALMEGLRRSTVRQWRQMRASGLAVPAPSQLWSGAEWERMRRRRRVDTAALQGLPALNGLSPLSLVWEAGRRDATAAALEVLGLPSNRTPGSATARRRQRDVVNEILGR